MLNFLFADDYDRYMRNQKRKDPLFKKIVELKRFITLNKKRDYYTDDLKQVMISEMNRGNSLQWRVV